MTKSKLIIIEGLPGSGKSTTARFVEQWLKQHHYTPALFTEGSWDHPADFESAACLDQDEYRHLKLRFPHHNQLLDSLADKRGEDVFFSYRKIQQEYGEQVPNALIEALSCYEIYELPVEKYKRLVLQRWQTFTGKVAHNDTIFIFECAFMQNPLTMLLGRNNESFNTAASFVRHLAASVYILEPRLIYLHPGDIESSIKTMAASRPPEWLDFVVHYHTEQGHGKVKGWKGVDGLIEFYKMRANLELDLLSHLPIMTLAIQHTDWEEDHARVASFLSS
jgi:hypothetical protein